MIIWMKNFHMKDSQSNLKNFEGIINKKTVKYEGKIPDNIKFPHFTYILKHVYSYEKGIHKIVVYSIPHYFIQKEFFQCIQKVKNRRRPIKCETEFRFNMKNDKGEPYKFLGQFQKLDIKYF